MKEERLIAAVLTVAFYVGRGASIGLPQILATYNELRAMLEKPMPRKRKKG